MIKPLTCFSIFLSVTFTSCSKAEGDDTLACDTVSKTFSADVDPIIQSSCNLSSCHNAGSLLGPGPLTNYSQVFNARAAVLDAVASGRMPLGGMLTTNQRNMIICWIDSGAPNN